MNRTTLRTLLCSSIAAASLLTMTVAVTAQADGGLRNCVDITGDQANRVGCYEHVWASGAEYRMTFSNVTFSGATPKDLDPFYVTAQQGAEAQGPVETFPHDHTVDAIPKGNAGTYSTKLQGFFVLCSAQGLNSGACIAVWTSPSSDPLPFAQRVNGHVLTSTAVIEAGAADGDLVLVNLGPSAVILGSVSAAH